MPSTARCSLTHTVARWAVLLALLASGCTNAAVDSPYVPPPPIVENPALVPMIDRDLLWDQLVDVVDDYFPVQQEQRLRQVGDVIIEGRLDTVPVLSATVFEPWRRDAATAYDRLEDTLQPIRRRAIVRAMPTEHGYLIDVAVFKELEDLRQPMHSTVADATIRNDTSLERFTSPELSQAIEKGWIPRGRDAALEQVILRAVLTRFGIAPGGITRLPPVY